MISPNCPEHARLVLDLALGRLDDGSAAEAEVARETCPVCRIWWRAELGGEDMAQVDDVVASVFNDLELPDRRRGHGWLALAAAAVMALGATTLWLVQSPTTQSPGSVEPVIVERMAAIGSMDFEAPSAIPAQVVRPSNDFGRMFVAVENGDSQTGNQHLGAGEIVTADAGAEHGPVAAESESLFSGRFESGDLGDWVPST